MGTGWSVKFAARNIPADSLRKPLETALGRVIAQMSSWDDASILSQFHRQNVGQWMTAPAELSHVVNSGIRIARETDGAYDVTLGRLVSLWGFGPAGPRSSPPDIDVVSVTHLHSGWTKIAFSTDRTRICRHSDLHLDLSGIAKGFAVDLVAMTLRAHGITDYLVEIGGELLGRGVKPDGTPWWVEIDGDGKHVTPIMVGLHELAIATSGCERSFSSDGQRYSHTIDPRTGHPIDNGMISATVVHASCMEADAYATALMVMGAKRGIEFANRRGIAALVRYSESPVHIVAERMSEPFCAMLD